MEDHVDQHDGGGSAGWLSRSVALFHKIEIAYVLVTLAIALWGVVRMDRDMLDFSLLFGGACVAAAVVALWPGTPMLLHFAAETVLLVVAMGQLIGPRHDVLVFLNREIRSGVRWNNMPLTDRRILAWNIVASLALIWLLPGAALVGRVIKVSKRTPSVAILGVIALIIVWPALALLFAVMLQAFFF